MSGAFMEWDLRGDPSLLCNGVVVATVLQGPEGFYIEQIADWYDEVHQFYPTTSEAIVAVEKQFGIATDVAERVKQGVSK